MKRLVRTFGLASLGGCILPAAVAAACTVDAADPWIRRWFEAWELTSREILKLPDAPPPNLVFYDSTCVYTTLAVAAPGARSVEGPAFGGTKLTWHAAAHHDSLTLPDSSRLPVALMSFANHHRATGPYFVMAAPGYWPRKPGEPNQDPGVTGVFLHEFAHTRQIKGVLHIIGPIDSTWAYPEELDDDAVQRNFGSDSAYAAAYLAERDLLHRAAVADSLDEVRALAREALAMIRSRHARWFTGDKAVFAVLDDTFLSLEGAAQWSAAAWLAHPKGGGMGKDAAVAKMLGKGRWWVQDEGLALFLVVDRLLPGWPHLVFRDPSMGGVELLERAIQS
jgi:hypothetical protein